MRSNAMWWMVEDATSAPATVVLTPLKRRVNPSGVKVFLL